MGLFSTPIPNLPPEDRDSSGQPEPPVTDLTGFDVPPADGEHVAADEHEGHGH